jgi:hypothetical protein
VECAAHQDDPSVGIYTERCMDERTIEENSTYMNKESREGHVRPRDPEMAIVDATCVPYGRKRIGSICSGFWF